MFNRTRNFLSQISQVEAARPTIIDVVLEILLIVGAVVNFTGCFFVWSWGRLFFGVLFSVSLFLLWVNFILRAKKIIELDEGYCPCDCKER